MEAALLHIANTKYDDHRLALPGPALWTDAAGIPGEMSTIANDSHVEIVATRYCVSLNTLVFLVVAGQHSF